ncbi:MAG: pyridoxine 5'-phosphate synthase [Alphaproteobacteria bacterium]|jgi:pyridoxine 5-phosphate synthase|nr:pyridoxine 5'-phosphate synthase [Alphaproteobacteria bacterium]
MPIKLSVNIDHVATLRNARGGLFPDPHAAALMVTRAGAWSITMHLREDRRHVRDEDVQRVADDPSLKLNFEMAATDEMIGKIAVLKPYSICLVPEQRHERTTERGLYADGDGALREAVEEGQKHGALMSLFVDADPNSIALAAALGADIVELHTGPFCDAVVQGRFQDAQQHFVRLRDMAKRANDTGLRVHAGHGLDYTTAQHLGSIEFIEEMSIGFALMSDGLFFGLEHVVTRMLMAMETGRSMRPLQPGGNGE